LIKEDNVVSTGYKYRIERAFHTQFLSKTPYNVNICFADPEIPILSIYEQKHVENQIFNLTHNRESLNS
jgi:hypothetical protein